MKKLLPLICAFLLVLTSCSNDNDDTVLTPILITQMIETVVYNGTTETHTNNISYDGTKIISQNYGSDYINYTYTGNLITKSEYFHNNVVQTKQLYTYNSLEKLINYQRFEYNANNADYGTNVDYVYNSDGTVSYTKQSGQLPDLSPSSTGVMSFNSEGLVTTIVASTGYTYTYTYDTKNNPFKNVLGVDKIFFDDDDGSSFVRNVLSKVETSSFGSHTSNYSYTYNSSDFPAQSIENDGYETITRQFTYNQ